MSARPALEAQEATATARFVRMSATKARQVIDLIRGRPVEEARAVLRFTQRGATQPVSKVLQSAVANAEHNRGLPADELVVSRAWVDEGPTIRRYRPRALGRATRIRKRTCHISIAVARREELVAEPRGSRGGDGGRRRARRGAGEEPAPARGRRGRKETSPAASGREPGGKNDAARASDKSEEES